MLRPSTGGRSGLIVHVVFDGATWHSGVDGDAIEGLYI